MALLEAKNLSITFGGLKAVDDFNIEIEKGELPNDMELVGKMVADISYNNANEYFNF